MNRKVWKQPLTVVQKFMPNEYVAACGDENKVYMFTCDAGWTGLTGSTVYTNGSDGVMGTVMMWSLEAMVNVERRMKQVQQTILFVDT